MSQFSIEQSQQLIPSELSALNQLIRQSTQSEVALINQIAEYIIHAGGKRIRPLLLLLVYRMIASQPANCSSSQSNLDDKAVLMAAVVEFIHTSTLLHDDVVDSSDTRRNQKTANSLWGNAATVLVGDFLYSRSFQMMLKVKSNKVLEVLADTTNAIAEGEVLQLLETQNSALSLERYYQIINSKTAILFASSGEIAARLGGANERDIDHAREFARHLGILFQLSDDGLDYFGDAKTIGKSLGDDWAERKVTLPLIYAFESEQKQWFLDKFNPELLKEKKLAAKADLDTVIEQLKALKIDKKCTEIANFHKDQAIEKLNLLEQAGYENEFSKNLKQLSVFIATRES